jgi:hypothetical protein
MVIIMMIIIMMIIMQTLQREPEPESGPGYHERVLARSPH